MTRKTVILGAAWGFRYRFLGSILPLLLFGSLASNATADTVAFSSPGGLTCGPGDVTVNLGLVFTPKTNFSVSALGFYSLPGAAGPVPVGLYDSSGTLLASANVSPSDPVRDGYSFHSIAPVALGSGRQYTVVEFRGSNTGSCYGYSPPNQATNFLAYNYDNFQYGSNGYCPGTNCVPATGLAFTTQTSPVQAGGLVGAYYGPNFEISSGPSPQILPQLAFGGGWSTALYFTNLNGGPVSFAVNFIGNDGNPLSVPALGGSSVTVNLSGRGTAVIQAPNVGSLVEGYVSMALPSGVTSYGVFRGSAPGQQDQEAVVLLSGITATTSTLLFDDTNYITGVAVVNLASVSTTISVTAYGNQGNVIGTSSIPLAANAKTAVMLKNLPGLGGVAGTMGSVDFSAPIGNLAVLGLRFDGLAFTSIPTFDQ